MVVISDTSVLSNLWQVEHLFLLPALFEEAIIPPSVLQELSYGTNPPPLISETWIQIEAVSDQRLVSELRLQLDLGEAEAIALALEKTADLLLIDEAKGRRIAQEKGLTISGLLGVLLAAKAQGLIPKVIPLVDRLISEANFRVGRKLYEMIRMEAGE